MHTKRWILFVFAIVLAALACNLPGSSPAEVANQPDSAVDVGENQPNLGSNEEGTAAPTPTETKTPRPTTPPPVTFLGIADGDTVTAQIDPASGLPFTSFEVTPRVQYSKDLPTVALDADGLHVFSRTIRYQMSGDVQTVLWTPWHGNGEYVLDLWMFDKHGRPDYQETITVMVSGIPEGTPTMLKRFVQIYKDEFGLDVPAPPFALFSTRGEDTMAEWNRWTSVLYLQDRYYVVEYRTSGELWAYSNQLYAGKGTLGVCRPAGDYSILALVVDYPTNDLDVSLITEDINEVVAEANRDWADAAVSQGLDEPLLHIRNFPVYVSAAPRPGDFLSLAEIQSATGYDPMDFNLVAEFDLDRSKEAMSQYDRGAGGMAWMHYCEPGGRTEDINMATAISTGGKILPEIIYGHELSHMFGWNHEWPLGFGDSESMFRLGTNAYPYLMFGWTDTDGDGVVEILDETPYGMTP